MTKPPKDLFRRSWEEYGEALNRAMNHPRLQTTPEVFDVLALLAEGLNALVDAVDAEWYGTDERDSPRPGA